MKNKAYDIVKAAVDSKIGKFTKKEIKNFCGAEKCALYTVDNGRQQCELIDENGAQPEFLDSVVTSIGRTPYENAFVWENDLYAVKYNQELIGFIWAINFDAEKMMFIKETLELTTFLLGAVDKLLSKGASLLKIAFADYEIYRAGGDEFVIFCPDITEEKLSGQVAQLRADGKHPRCELGSGDELFRGRLRYMPRDADS